MGYIKITSVTFSPTPSTSQQVYVYYKLAGAPDSDYVQVSLSSFTVSSGGTFTPAVYINGLLDATEYTVKIQTACGGTAGTANFITSNDPPPDPDTCGEYVNTAGGTITNVGYTDCNGGVHSGESFDNGESICAQVGSVNGDDGNMSYNGTCSIPCNGWNITFGSGGGSIQWEDCTTGNVQSGFYTGSTTVCSRSMPVAIAGNVDSITGGSPC